MSITLVQKNKSKGIMTWYARVPDTHKKNSIHFFSLGTTSKSEAKIVMQERLKAGVFDLKDEAETMTLGEAAVKFEQYERSKGTKPGSITTFINAVNTLSTLFDRPIREITTKDINEAFVKSTSGQSSITYRNKKAMNAHSSLVFGFGAFAIIRSICSIVQKSLWAFFTFIFGIAFLIGFFGKISRTSTM